MRFIDRKQFHYDPKLAGLRETQTVLKMHAEYVRRYSPQCRGRPAPGFMEVDRTPEKIDPLWHQPKGGRIQFTSRSPIEMYAINKFQRPDWRLTRAGLTPQRRDQFWMANLHLEEKDYFPNRGDMVFWDGYRYFVENVIIPPESYWGQTGVWLGLVCECVIVPEGDHRPLKDVSQIPPAEQSESRSKSCYPDPDV